MDALEGKITNRFLIPDEEIEKNRTNYVSKFNMPYSELFSKTILAPIRDVWHRAKFVGFENFPKRNNPDAPLIFATNHSGMAFPWDAITFISKIVESQKGTLDNIRPLISPMLTKYPHMCPYMINELWWTTGCINASLLNFETGMKLNQYNILIFPEGLDGIGKGFDKKYKIQPLKTSFLRMSIRHKTDIIPFYTVNGEYNNPALNIKPISKICQKLGMPFFPFGPVIFLSILQPWIFYATLPAKVTYVMGKRIKVYEMVDKPYEELTQKDLKIIGEKIRCSMQQKLDEAVRKYGNKHYDIIGLLKTMKRNKKHFFRYFPAFWPLTMTYFDVNFKEYLKKGEMNFHNPINWIKTFVSRPIVLAMYMPIIGWFIIGAKSKSIIQKQNLALTR